MDVMDTHAQDNEARGQFVPETKKVLLSFTGGINQLSPAFICSFSICVSE